MVNNGSTFRQYTLRYVVKVDGVTTFMNMQVETHDKMSKVRMDYKDFSPLQFQDEKIQERVKSNLLGIIDTTWRMWSDA